MSIPYSFSSIIIQNSTISALDGTMYVNGTALATVTQLVAETEGKANIASPAFTGVPTAPTAAQGTNTLQLATTAFVRAELAALVAGAPSTLDTLDEIAAALNDDANIASTLTTAIGGKQPLNAFLTHLSTWETGTDYSPDYKSVQRAVSLYNNSGTGVQIEAWDGEQNHSNYGTVHLTGYTKGAWKAALDLVGTNSDITRLAGMAGGTFAAPQITITTGSGVDGFGLSANGDEFHYVCNGSARMRVVGTYGGGYGYVVWEPEYFLHNCPNPIQYSFNANGMKIVADSNIVLTATSTGGTLAGTWNAPTPAVADNSTKIATTAHVKTQIAGGFWDYSGPQKLPGASVRKICPITGNRFDNGQPMNGQVCFFAFYFNQAMPAVDSVKINLFSGTHGSEVVYFALYNVDPVTRKPTTKIANSDATFSLASTGVITVNYGTKPAVPQGMVWGAITCSTTNTGTVNPAFVSASNESSAGMHYQSIFGVDGDPNMYWGPTGITESGRTSLPADYTAIAVGGTGTHAGPLYFGIPYVMLTGV